MRVWRVAQFQQRRQARHRLTIRAGDQNTVSANVEGSDVPNNQRGVGRADNGLAPVKIPLVGEVCGGRSSNREGRCPTRRQGGVSGLLKDYWYRRGRGVEGPGQDDVTVRVV